VNIKRHRIGIKPVGGVFVCRGGSSDEGSELNDKAA
jgi:hypothetical protein